MAPTLPSTPELATVKIHISWASLCASEPRLVAAPLRYEEAANDNFRVKNVRMSTGPANSFMLNLKKCFTNLLLLSNSCNYWADEGESRQPVTIPAALCYLTDDKKN
jgi:hypothetical protein